jgi:hypothetical protein
MFTRTCALEECTVEFQTDLSKKKFCTPAHANLSKVRAWKKRHKKKGGGGGNGGGGGAPTLFDEIVPIDSRSSYVPDTCYRTPPETPDTRKPSTPVRAFKKAA